MRFGLVLIAYTIVQHGIINAQVAGLNVVDDSGLGDTFVAIFVVTIVMDIFEWIIAANHKIKDQ